MSDIAIETAADIADAELERLYNSVGWSAYTREPAVLRASLAGSHRIMTARNDGKLVGLARTISDGATIAYLQDVLVDPAEQRTGIGRALVERLFAIYGDIRQRVLLTDAGQSQRSFYESLGFAETHDHEPPLRAFVRLG